MIKLSDRLQMIADLIEKGQTVADIGTDHGFLPMFLWESKKSPKVILADISKGSLQKAIDNVYMQDYNEETIKKYFDFRLGNGIQVLENGEVDTVVIAGMGGILMTEILGDNIEKTKSIKKFILQPRNGQGKLRWWLLNNGFTILDEKLVREGKFICEIIFVEVDSDKNKGNPSKTEAEDIKYELPESILMSNDSLALEFTEKKLKVEIDILEKMKKAKISNDEKIHQMENRILYLENLLEKYKK